MDRSSEFPWQKFQSDSWTAAQVGDSVEGRIIGLEVKDGRSGPVPVVALDVGDGQHRSVWAGAADLKSQLAALAPGVGDYLKITFVGERHTGQASPMKLFEISTVEPVVLDDDERPF